MQDGGMAHKARLSARTRRHAILCLALLLLAGCASTGGGVDPLKPMNRRFYEFNNDADRLIMKPVAHVYKRVAPAPLRASLTHFFRNVAYPNVIVNDLLQGRFQQSASDVGRFVVNSTIGVFGLFDVATPLGLKAHKEDAGLTLARWGVGRGPYLVLPFIGPDTLRNTPSLVLGIFTNVLFYVGNSALTVPLTIFDVLNTRANLSSSIRYVDENALDPYVFTRDAYLQHRNYLLYGGHLPLKAVEDMMLPPSSATGPQSGDPPPLMAPERAKPARSGGRRRSRASGVGIRPSAPGG